MKMFTDNNLVVFVCGTDAHLCRSFAPDSWDSDHKFTPTGGKDHSYACMREPKDMESLKQLSRLARNAGARTLVLRGMHGTWSYIVKDSALPVVEIVQWKRLQAVEDCRRIDGEDYTVWNAGDHKSFKLSKELDPKFALQPYKFL